MLIINDTNYRDHVKQNEDRGRGLVERDWNARPYGDAGLAGTFQAAAVPIIPRSQWSARIRHLTDTRRRLSDLMKAAGVPCLHQSSLGYCHGAGPAGGIMGIRAFRGFPTVKISLSSIAAPTVGFVNRGAWIMDDLRQVATHGWCTVEEYPEVTTERRYWNAQNQAIAATRRLTNWYEGQRRSFDQTVSCLLNQIPVVVGLNWWGHCVFYADVIEIRPGVFAVLARNSWGSEYGDDGWFVLEEGRATPDEQYAPLTTMAA